MAPATSSNSFELTLDENAKISWVEDIMDVGTIKQNVPKEVDFKFTNVGTEPLLISSVKTSCGCTTTYYPTEAIQPGASARISATYNAKSIGAFSKTISVSTNAKEGVKKLTIKGIVAKN